MVALAIRFREDLEGALRLGSSPNERSMRLSLRGTAQLPGFLAGAPAPLAGEVSAPSVGLDAIVEGTLRFVRAADELVYKLAGVDGTGGVIELEGSKRGLWADPYAALTTLPLVVRQTGKPLGRAVLRFDARGGLFSSISRMSVAWG